MTARRQAKPATLFKALDDELRRRPRGTIRAMERELGWAPGWWHGRSRTGDVASHQLRAALEYLGLDPVAFVRRHWGSEHGLELDRPQGPPPVIVELASRSFRTSQEIVGLGETFLDDLDERGYHDPAWALKAIEANIEIASRRELPRLLGTAGAAFRVQIRLEEAAHCFYEAMTAAHTQGEYRSLGNLLRRYSYLVSDHGAFERALVATERAAGILAREEDYLGVAKASIEQGLWLYCLERWTPAISALKSGLSHLPEGSSRYAFTAWHTLALVHKEQGDLQRAMESVASAVNHVSGISERNSLKLGWLKANIHKELGQLGDADLLLEGVARNLQRIHAGDAALATCDLVRVRLLRGLGSEAFEAALTMKTLVEPLRFNPVISAAIAALLRGGKAGLTLELLRQSRLAIASQRGDRRAWYQLRSQG